MVVGGVNKCIKYALFLFNFAFVLIGIALLAIGISTQNGFRYLRLVDTGSFAAPPKFLIAIGVVMFLIAFLGCCGSWKENHPMIMAYSVLVGLILILQLGVGIAAFLLADDVENLARTGLTETLHQYHNQSNPEFEDIRHSWDMIQSELKCCGVNNYTDWADVAVKTPPINDTLVASSCCIDGAHENCAIGITKKNINETAIAEKIVYIEGCLHKAVDNLAIARIGWVGIGLGVVELLGILCACLLARSIRFSYETV